jgi:hypothetical protein
VTGARFPRGTRPPATEEVRVVCQGCADRGRQGLLALAQRSPGDTDWLLFLVRESDRHQVVAENFAGLRGMARMYDPSTVNASDQEKQELLARDIASARRLQASSRTQAEALQRIVGLGIRRRRFVYVRETEGLFVLPCRKCPAVPRISVQKLRARVQAAWRSPTRTVYLE